MEIPKIKVVKIYVHISKMIPPRTRTTLSMVAAEENKRGTGRGVVSSQVLSPTLSTSTEVRADWIQFAQVSSTSGTPPPVRRN